MLQGDTIYASNARKQREKRKHPHTFWNAEGISLMGGGKEDNGLVFENL